MKSAQVTITTTSDGDIAIIFPNEESMVFDSADNNAGGVTFIRFLNLIGEEIVGWSCDEWRDDPEAVMGAILGKLCECLTSERENNG